MEHYHKCCWAPSIPVGLLLPHGSTRWGDSIRLLSHQEKEAQRPRALQRPRYLLVQPRLELESLRCLADRRCAIDPGLCQKYLTDARRRRSVEGTSPLGSPVYSATNSMLRSTPSRVSTASSCAWVPTT